MAYQVWWLLQRYKVSRSLEISSAWLGFETPTYM